MYIKKLLFLFFVCFLGMACVPPRDERCPNVESEKDNTACCEALIPCCKNLPDGSTALKNCNQRVKDQAPLSCQSLYQELYTNDKC